MGPGSTSVPPGRAPVSAGYPTAAAGPADPACLAARGGATVLASRRTAASATGPAPLLQPASAAGGRCTSPAGTACPDAGNPGTAGPDAACPRMVPAARRPHRVPGASAVSRTRCCCAGSAGLPSRTRCCRSLACRSLARRSLACRSRRPAPTGPATACSATACPETGCPETTKAAAAPTGNAARSGTGSSRAASRCSTASCSAVRAGATLARRHTRPNATTSSFSASGAIRHQVEGSPM